MSSVVEASFGPTRETLSELSTSDKSAAVPFTRFYTEDFPVESRRWSCRAGQKSHSDWILEQMNLPVESLREYYRERVNPFYKSDVDSERDFKPYTPCSPGSRWRRFVFMLSDNRKQVEVAGGQIFVEGAFRSDIPTGLFASRWSGVSALGKHVCMSNTALHKPRMCKLVSKDSGTTLRTSAFWKRVSATMCTCPATKAVTGQFH